MTPEQEQLVLQIVSRFDDDAIVVDDEGDGYTGRQEHCRRCGARGEGHYGSYEVTHYEGCITRLVSKLRDTMR